MARIRQLHSMMTTEKDLPFYGQDIKDLTNSLMLNVGSQKLPAEVNVKLSKSIGKLERFVREQKQTVKDLGDLKVEIWEPLIKIS
ncbi:MAG: hypothetical protein WC511_07985 [Candidatus Pacearchaeota archaeon]